MTDNRRLFVTFWVCVFVVSWLNWWERDASEGLFTMRWIFFEKILVQTVVTNQQGRGKDAFSDLKKNKKKLIA